MLLRFITWNTFCKKNFSVVWKERDLHKLSHYSPESRTETTQSCRMNFFLYTIALNCQRNTGLFFGTQKTKQTKIKNKNHATIDRTHTWHFTQFCHRKNVIVGQNNLKVVKYRGRGMSRGGRGIKKPQFNHLEFKKNLKIILRMKM